MSHATGISREIVSGLVFGTLFLVMGPFMGIAAAQHVAGDSTLATVASAAVLPLGFMAANTAWTVWFFTRAAVKGAAALARRTRGEPAPPRKPASPDDAVPGAWVFVPTLASFCLVAGILAGLPAGGWGVLQTAAAYVAVGTALGAAMWRLGRAGVVEPLIFS